MEEEILDLKNRVVNLEISNKKSIDLVTQLISTLNSVREELIQVKYSKAEDKKKEKAVSELDKVVDEMLKY